MEELSFRGKDRYRPSWPYIAGAGLAVVGQGVYVFFRLGVVTFCWLTGGLIALTGLAIFKAFRSWTRVGAAGITIYQGIGRGRTYSWRQIRWIDVREIKSQYGTSLRARITLVDGRRRTLPALQHSIQYPDSDFHVDFQRVVDWWKVSTDPAARSQPPKRLRDFPVAVGIIVGLLICIIIGLVIREFFPNAPGH